MSLKQHLKEFERTEGPTPNFSRVPEVGNHHKKQYLALTISSLYQDTL